MRSTDGYAVYINAQRAAKKHRQSSQTQLHEWFIRQTQQK